MVAEPGIGSLTVTRPTRVVVGAEEKFGAVSREAGPPKFGVGQSSCRGTGEEVGATELASMISSGVEKHLDAIEPP